MTRPPKFFILFSKRLIFVLFQLMDNFYFEEKVKAPLQMFFILADGFCNKLNDTELLGSYCISKGFLLITLN